jgi:hypothetical protein
MKEKRPHMNTPNLDTFFCMNKVGYFLKCCIGAKDNSLEVNFSLGSLDWILEVEIDAKVVCMLHKCQLKYTFLSS